MKTKELTNKEGEKLIVQEGENKGKVLVENTLEVGDEFIPVFNGINEGTHKANVKGEEKNIDNYSIKARVRNKDGEKIEIEGSEEIFIKLTTAQANALKKKKENGIELNQNLFVAYEYDNKYGKQIGVGLKGSNKPAKTFEDIEEDNE